MRHALIRFAVERAWPAALAVYFFLAASAMLHTDTHVFVLYAFDSPAFATVVYLTAGALALPTMIWPCPPLLRWTFFIVAGFALTGRMLQYTAGHWGLEEAARDAFVFGALVAHSVMQVDWMIERSRDEIVTGK